MKKIIFLIIISLLLMSYGCGARLYNYEKSGAYMWVSPSAKEVLLNAESRGYITLDEFRYVEQKTGLLGVDHVIQKELLPYRGMFYIALEKEKYKDAERIRKEWIGELNRLCRYITGGSRQIHLSYTTPNKLMSEINKLENIVGLTDPMLMSLRKELTAAIENKDWDNAQKIQNLITAKTNELRPSQTSGGQPGGTVIVQQPSSIQVENVPRYGAEDVARAMSLLAGQGGHLGSEELGALRLFDILMGR